MQSTADGRYIGGKADENMRRKGISRNAVGIDLKVFTRHFYPLLLGEMLKIIRLDIADITDELLLFLPRK